MEQRNEVQGGHAVFEREKGKTVLENQVRIATMLKCEMDPERINFKGQNMSTKIQIELIVLD